MSTVPARRGGILFRIPEGLVPMIVNQPGMPRISIWAPEFTALGPLVKTRIFAPVVYLSIRKKLSGYHQQTLEKKDLLR